MKTYYEQLRELLCEAPEIKDQIGIKGKYRLENRVGGFCFSGSKEECQEYLGSGKAPSGFFKIVFKDFGNTKIEERHIRMYCKDNDLFMWIHNDGEWYIDGGLYSNVKLKLDNSKPFHLQDEQVYKQLVEYFKSLK